MADDSDYFDLGDSETSDGQSSEDEGGRGCAGGRSTRLRTADILLLGTVAAPPVDADAQAAQQMAQQQASAVIQEHGVSS